VPLGSSTVIDGAEIRLVGLLFLDFLKRVKMKKLLMLLLSTLVLIASPALATDQSSALAYDGVYQGVLVDTSVGQTYCSFSGVITIAVQGHSLHAKITHSIPFSAEIDASGHFDTVVDRNRGSPMAYEGDVSGTQITGTYRLTGQTVGGRGGHPSHCKGTFSAMKQ